MSKIAGLSPGAVEILAYVAAKNDRGLLPTPAGCVVDVGERNRGFGKRRRALARLLADGLLTTKGPCVQIGPAGRVRLSRAAEAAGAARS